MHFGVASHQDLSYKYSMDVVDIDEISSDSNDSIHSTFAKKNVKRKQVR